MSEKEPESPYGWLFGYARVSTDDQDLSLQRKALIAFGVPADRIIEEHASGKTMKRKRLRSLLDRSLREGDTLVVWKLDRLGRTLTGVIDAVEEMQKQGINVVSLTEKIDTTTAMGRAFFQISLVFAELERNLISERTKAGMRARIEEGAKFGRAHKIKDNPKRMEAARELADDGLLTVITDRELMNALNEADPKDKINSIETVRRWRRGDKKKGIKPFDGLEAVRDTPMSETEPDEGADD